MAVFLWAWCRLALPFDFVRRHGIDRDVIDLFVHHQDQAPVPGVTRDHRAAGTPAGFLFQRVADHGFDVFGSESVFRDVFDIASRLVVPNDIIPRHAASRVSWLLLVVT